jgi:hypothetical protein
VIPTVWGICGGNNQRDRGKSIRVSPDFSKVSAPSGHKILAMATKSWGHKILACPAAKDQLPTRFGVVDVFRCDGRDQSMS